MSHQRWMGWMVTLLASPLAAQELPAGTWNGTFQIDRGPQVPIEFVAAATTDSYHFIRSATGDVTQLRELRVVGRGVAFRWGEFQCRLVPMGSGQKGGCKAGDGTSGRMSLTPPVVESSNGMDLRLARASGVVTREELLATRARNLYDALPRLRPLWFRVRVPAGDELPNITVFVQGQPRGNVQVLQEMGLGPVQMVRYYNSSRAIMRFGKKYALGVIEIDEAATRQ
jgi:hypothetical protein